jgi:hypothetical protein
VQRGHGHGHGLGHGHGHEHEHGSKVPRYPGWSSARSRNDECR